MAYKMIQIVGSVSSVEDAVSALTELGEEMRSWADNMEGAGTGLENTEKFQTVSSTADELENISELEIPECLLDIDLEVQIGELVNKNKRAGCSRAIRRDNACAILNSVKEAIEESKDNLELSDEEEQDVDQFLSEIDEILGYAENAEFPGMFG